MSIISPYKKRSKAKKLQPYIVGSIMILLVLILALILIYSSSDKTLPVDTINSDAVSEIPSSQQTSVPMSEQEPKSSKEEIILPESKLEIPKSNSSGNAFSADEVAQIDALIARYEMIRVPLSSISSEASSSEVSSFKDISSNTSQDISSGNSSDTVSSEIMVDVKSNVSIYYEDLTTGDTFYNNEDYKYFIASLIKAPYCMYLYNLAEQGKCDLDELLTIEYEKIQKGTGKIKDMKKELFPLQMSVRELMSYSIRSSDNTAMETLRKKYDHVGYLEYAKSLGLNYPNDVLRIVNGRITAKDAGVYIKAIYSYIETGKYGAELKEDMMNTTNTLIRSKYMIARKYGWADLSFHDMAVVYTPKPYLLVILSDKDMGYASDYSFMAELSTLIGKFHQEKYKYD